MLKALIVSYNPANNFGLSFDKTDRVKQNRTMVIRRLFYFDGIKVKKGASFQAKLLIGHGKQNNTFYKSQ